MRPPKTSKPKAQFHITDFSVVATADDKYRVDAHVAELREPVKGKTFLTLDQAKAHIVLSQQMLAQKVN